MPVPLALAPLVAVVFAVGLFFLIRWWLGKTGAAVFFTLSLLLNLAILAPVVLAFMVLQEIQDFQEKMPVTQKLVLVEKGTDVLLAASFTEVKDIEKGLSSFKPLSKDQVQRIQATLGDARYSSLARDYYKVFVIEREFLEKLAAPSKSGQTGPQDGAIQSLLLSARDAFQSGDLDKASKIAADLQKAYRERGMNDAADLARQVEQAAKAKDLATLTALAPRLAQLALPGNNGIPLPGLGGTSGGLLTALPLAGDIILKAIDADDPAKVLLPYLPQQTIQELSGGDPARLKIALIAYLFGARLQSNFDPIFLVSEYTNGDIRVYPETSVSLLVRLLPVGQLDGLPLPKPKP